MWGGGTARSAERGNSSMKWSGYVQYVGNTVRLLPFPRTGGLVAHRPNDVVSMDALDISGPGRLEEVADVPPKGTRNG